MRSISPLTSEREIMAQVGSMASVMGIAESDTKGGYAMLRLADETRVWVRSRKKWSADEVKQTQTITGRVLYLPYSPEAAANASLLDVYVIDESEFSTRPHTNQER